jgi:hypothetical protein
MSGQVQAAVDAGRSEVTQGSDCFGQVWIVSFEEYGQWRTDVGDQFHNGKGYDIESSANVAAIVREGEYGRYDIT